ncbi:hypothetical protein [Spirochaeta cellobiosiphila]|uniref:hypothetical protein n=1 Tax=Spirochaeta cellobiosiphila TaxID=504483 RepID=UPI0004148FB2|nr:hypothetical protein [Spirochaeta cellobiosiphila]
MKKITIYLSFYLIISTMVFSDDFSIDLVDKLGKELKFRDIAATYCFVTDDIIFSSGADTEPVLFSISENRIIKKVPVEIYERKWGWLGVRSPPFYNDNSFGRTFYFQFGKNRYSIDQSLSLNEYDKETYDILKRHAHDKWFLIDKELDSEKVYFIQDSSMLPIRACKLKQGYEIHFGEDTLYNQTIGEEDLSRVKVYKDGEMIMGLEDVVPNFYHSIWDSLQYDVSPNKEYIIILGWEGITWEWGKNRYPYEDVYLFKINYPE